MLDWLINKNVADSKLGISVFNEDTGEVKFNKTVNHSNFFNGSITQRKVSSLKEAAAGWAREHGYDSLADMLENS